LTKDSRIRLLTVSACSLRLQSLAGLLSPLTDLSPGSWHQVLPGHFFFHTAAYYGRLNVGYLAVLGSQPPDHQMFWAACSLGYFGFLRVSEFTVPNLSTFSASLHLSVQDIAVDSSSAPSSMRVRIKGFKTDPFRKGCFVHLGLGGHPLCAGQAMMSYLVSRGDAPGPLFLFTNGQPLTRTNLMDWLRQILASAQIPGNFSSHSFRIGAATVAARNGVPDHLIQTMGRWSSNAYQLYIRTPADSLAALSHKLALLPSMA